MIINTNFLNIKTLTYSKLYEYLTVCPEHRGTIDSQSLVNNPNNFPSNGNKSVIHAPAKK